MKKAAILTALVFIVITACGRNRPNDNAGVSFRDLQLPLAGDASTLPQTSQTDILSEIPLLSQVEVDFSVPLSTSPAILGGNLRAALIVPREVNTLNILHGSFVPTDAIATRSERTIGTGVRARVFGLGLRLVTRNLESAGFFDEFIADIINPPLLAHDARGYVIFGDDHDEAIIATVDRERHTITKTFREDAALFWQDGAMLTMDDILFMYERMIWVNRAEAFVGGQAHPVLNIVGAPEFARGEATELLQ